MMDALHEAIGAYFESATRMDVEAVMRRLDAAGYAIVPKEPTDAMIKAGDEVAGTLAITHDYSATLMWERMIEAATKA
jgi:hypothetical protein